VVLLLMPAFATPFVHPIRRNFPQEVNDRRIRPLVNQFSEKAIDIMSK